MARTARFVHLKRCFAEKFHLKTVPQDEATKFEFDDEIIYDNFTPMPGSLDMDENDEIKVSARDININEVQSCKVLIVSS